MVLCTVSFFFCTLWRAGLRYVTTNIFYLIKIIINIAIFFFLLHSFVCLSEVCQVWNWLLKIWIWIEFGIEKPCAVAFQNENQYSVERKSAFLLICGDTWYHLAVNLHFWKEKSSFWKCGCSSAMFLYFWWTGFDLFFNISSNMRHCLLLESHSGKYYLNRS